MPKRKTIRRIQPWERLPMHHAEEVGGDKEVALLETPGGDFKIQTRGHEYPLDADDDDAPEVVIEAENVFILNKAQIQPDDIKRLSSLDEAGIRGGIHSKRTYLMALKDGSLWIWKQTGNEERDEIFVYQLALKMFRGIVPEVQPVYVPRLGWGSAMRKVAGIPAGRVDGLHGYFHGNEDMQADLVAMLVLDYLTGNPDRHANNWFIMHNDRLAAIDNGWAGEDPTMTLSAVFEPANLAGLVRDESLWPKMLQMMLELIEDLSGRGDEARALAQEISIDRKEAVAMVRLWEPKLHRMARFIQAEASKLTKERVYVKPGTQPPLGVQVETGPRGGTYYESEGIPAGMEEEEKKPQEAEPQVLTREALTEAEMFNDGVFERWVEDYKVSNDVGGELKLRETMKDDIVSTIAEKTGIDYERVNEYIGAWAGSSTQSSESIAMQNAAADLFGLERNAYIKEQGQYRGAGGDYRTGPQYALAKSIVQAMYEETQEWLKSMNVDHLVLFRGMRWSQDDAPGEAHRSIRVGGADVHLDANPLSSWSSDPQTAQEFANYTAEGAESEPDYEAEEYLECMEEQKDADRGLNRERAREEWEAQDMDGEFDEEVFDAEFDDNYDESDSDCEPPNVSPTQIRAFVVAKVPAEKIIALSVTGLGCLNEREVIVAGGLQTVRMYSEESEDEAPLSYDALIEEAEATGQLGVAPKEPKTAQQQQQQQQNQWFKDNIEPLFERLTQQQADLQRDYTKRVEAADTAKDRDRVGDEYRELYNEMQADTMAEGKKMITAAGYIPHGGWEAAVEAPPSPELVAWRKEHYKEWVEENLADDAKVWIDRANALDEKRRTEQQEIYEALGRTLNEPDVDAKKAHLDTDYEIRVGEARYQNAKLGSDVAYFRLGAKKIREAGFEPEGRFAMQERDDAKANKARTYIDTPEQAPQGAPVETGPRGGLYYESEPPLPGFEGVPPRQRYEEQPPAHPRTVLDSTEDTARQQEILEAAKERAIEQAVEGKPEFQGEAPGGHAVRGAVKDALTRDISQRSEVPYERVAAYISSWSSSSSDANIESLALQIAAANLFALPATDFIKASWEEHGGQGRMGQPGGEDTKAERLGEAASILRAMYDNTQEYLKENGIESLVLYRGMRWFDNEGPNPTPDEFGYATGDKLAGGFRRLEVEFHANPLSSWATDFNDARVFANFKPEGADEYDDELNWEDETFQQEAREKLQAEWESFAREQDIPVGDEDEKEKWETDALGNYGGDVGMWAYQESDMLPPALLPSLTRAISIVEVPREKIIATALTGLGCLNENEVVISGGEFNQTTYLSDDYSGSTAFPHADSIEEMEIQHDEEKRFMAIYQGLVTDAKERLGHDPDAYQVGLLRQEARTKAQEERVEPRRKPITEEEPKTVAEMESKKEEIPEEALAARLAEMREDPALDTTATYHTMVSLLHEWWSRKEEKWRQASAKLYDDKSLNEDQRTAKGASTMLAQAQHRIDYQARIRQAAKSIGFVPPERADPVKTLYNQQYDDNRIEILQRLVDGVSDPSQTPLMAVATFKKKQENIYGRVVAQRELHEHGYDPQDAKLVRIQQSFTRRFDEVKKEGWPGGGTDFNEYFKKHQAKLKRLQAAFDKKLAQFEKVEKMLTKARTYLRPGQQAPAGTQEEEGPRGGRYYESEGRGAAEEERPPPGSYDEWVSRRGGPAVALPPDPESWARMKEINDRYGTEAKRWPADDQHSIAQLMKKQVTRDIMAGTREDEGIVEEFIRSWAASSSDDNSYSLAMQMGAAQMFGVETTDFIKESWENVEPEHWARQLATRHGKYGEVADRAQAKELMLVSSRNILRHVYERTQEWLKDKGITHVTLGRGQQWSPEEAPPEIAEGFKLTQEQFDDFYQRRMAQYDAKEKKALDSAEALPSIDPTDVLALKERYAEARETLKGDLIHEPREVLKRIQEDDIQQVGDESAKRQKLIRGRYITADAYGRFQAVGGTTEEQKENELQWLDERRVIEEWERSTKEGIRDSFEDAMKWDGEVDFQQNPMSSWSISHTTAKEFALMRVSGDSVGVTMWAEVPAEHIISTPFTGPGCLSEREFLVKGGHSPVYYRAVDYDKDAFGGPIRKEHLDPWDAMETEEREADNKKKQVKPLKQVTKLLAQGDIDAIQAETLEGYLLSGHPTKLKMALQTIDFYIQEAANEAG